MTTTYNGWTNRATWNASLWLNNDQENYELLQTVLDAFNNFEGALVLNNIMRRHWGDMTPDGEALDDVNWLEVIKDNRK